MELAQMKKRKPNWSERELTHLAETILPHAKMLKAKFSLLLTSEQKQNVWRDITERVNSTTSVVRSTDEIKKKWADMQSLTKKKEMERRKAMKETGGGVATEIYFKEWEKLVLESLSNAAIEGIPCGVDTADKENLKQPLRSLRENIIKTQEESSTNPITASMGAGNCANSDVCNVTDHITTNDTLTTVLPAVELERNDSSKCNSHQGKYQESAKVVGETINIQELFLELEREKERKAGEYKRRKLELLEESLVLQHRRTIALENIATYLGLHDNEKMQAVLSVSPEIEL